MYNIIGLIAVLLVFVTSALYSRKGIIAELTNSNFESSVPNGNSNWVILFYAPSCTYSQSILYEYEKAAATLKGVVAFGAVDGDVHCCLRGKYEVKSYPNIKIFDSKKKTFIDFCGPRTSKAIIEAASGTVDLKDQYISFLDMDKMVIHKDDKGIMDIYPAPCPISANLALDSLKTVSNVKVDAVDNDDRRTPSDVVPFGNMALKLMKV